MRKTPLLFALAAFAATDASAQGFGADVDETAGGGMEEAAALYFAAPPTEEAEPVLDSDRLADAGTVQLAISLGQVEDGLRACQDLRREMQALIGDTYGSYSVNPGWLRRYQSCVLQRAEEAKMVGSAIKARQTELISRISAESDEGTSEDAMRTADLMARLSARQSAVKLEVSREARKQRAFVRYYNTGEFPDALRETRERPQVRVPAGERPLDGPAPVRIDPAASPLPREDAADVPFGGTVEEEPGIGSAGGGARSGPSAEPEDARPMPEQATGAPVSLRSGELPPAPRD